MFTQPLEKSAQHPLRKIIKPLSFAQVVNRCADRNDALRSTPKRLMTLFNASVFAATPRHAQGVAAASIGVQMFMEACAAPPGTPSR